jgi:prephenate dehydratase
MLVGMVIKCLKENRTNICNELNARINVPLVSEKKEQACIESIFDSFVEVLEKVLAK